MLRFYSPTEKCTVTTRRRKNEISEGANSKWTTQIYIINIFQKVLKPVM
jgi:hypothetical protein